MRLPKSIIITGANGQTSIRLAEVLLQRDCQLILLAHQRTDRIAALQKQHSQSCRLVQCDLADMKSTAEVVADIFQQYGTDLTGLVHAAAIRSYDAQPLAESDAETWNRIFSDNIRMAYNILRCVLPVFIQQNRGKIVLFGSNVTRTGLPYGSAYAAAKSALANLVRSLAWETAESNVQINMVSPAPIETKLEEDYKGAYLKFRQEYFEAYKKSHPAHQLVKPEDIVNMILPLLDLDSTSVSGEEIYITGGVL
jgi:NAD(P)-dependent dehydrogenase (short-subunit alcohol dehydrogenase family)